MKFSIVPEGIKDKSRDPRSLAKIMPNMIRENNQSFIGFIKRMQVFDFYNSLSAIEEYAHANNYILLPASIMHWRRCSFFGDEKRIRVGRKSFYLVRENELTKKEKSKLLDHIKEVRRVRI